MNSQRIITKLEEVAKIGTWFLDINENSLFWSDAVYDVHEVKRGTKILVEEGINYYIPEHRPVIRKCINQAIADKKPWDVELQILTKSGKVKWVRALGQPVFKESKLVGLEGIFQEIDSQKKLSSQLALANQKISVVLNAASIGFWEWNLESDRLIWDENMKKIYGHEKSSDLVNYDLWKGSIFPEDRDIVFTQLEAAVENNEVFDTEFRIIRGSDQAVRYIKAVGTFVSDGQSKKSLMIGINKDITLEKENELKYQHSSRELQNVFDAIPGLVMHKSADDIMVRVNKYAADMKGLKPEDMNGRKSSDFYDKVMCDKYHEDDMEVIRSGRPKLGIIEKVEDKFGDMNWIRTDKTPYYDQFGNVTGVVLCAFDMNEQMKAQEELRKLNEELIQFNYRISHDLGAPLASIKGLSFIAQSQMRSKDYEEVNNNLIKISQTTDRLRRLINDLLSLSKSAHLEETQDQFVFKKEISEVISDLNYEAQVIVTLNLQVESVLTNPVRLRQVIHNLVSNAIKYRDHDKEVSTLEISVEKDLKTDKLLVTVKDNGLGISKTQHSKVFQMFQRFHHEQRGSGLGLYLVKRHIEALKGRIYFESTEFEGSKFVICLPLNM